MGLINIPPAMKAAALAGDVNAQNMIADALGLPNTFGQPTMAPTPAAPAPTVGGFGTGDLSAYPAGMLDSLYKYLTYDSDYALAQQQLAQQAAQSAANTQAQLGAASISAGAQLGSAGISAAAQLQALQAQIAANIQLAAGGDKNAALRLQAQLQAAADIQNNETRKWGATGAASHGWREGLSARNFFRGVGAQPAFGSAFGLGGVPQELKAPTIGFADYGPAPAVNMSLPTANTGSFNFGAAVSGIPTMASGASGGSNLAGALNAVAPGISDWVSHYGGFPKAGRGASRLRPGQAIEVGDDPTGRGRENREIMKLNPDGTFDIIPLKQSYGTGTYPPFTAGHGQPGGPSTADYPGAPGWKGPMPLTPPPVWDNPVIAPKPGDPNYMGPIVPGAPHVVKPVLPTPSIATAAPFKTFAGNAAPVGPDPRTITAGAGAGGGAQVDTQTPQGTTIQTPEGVTVTTPPRTMENRNDMSVFQPRVDAFTAAQTAAPTNVIPGAPAWLTLPPDLVGKVNPSLETLIQAGVYNPTTNAYDATKWNVFRYGGWSNPNPALWGAYATPGGGMTLSGAGTPTAQQGSVPTMAPTNTGNTPVPVNNGATPMPNTGGAPPVGFNGSNATQTGQEMMNTPAFQALLGYGNQGFPGNQTFDLPEYGLFGIPGIAQAAPLFTQGGLTPQEIEDLMAIFGQGYNVSPEAIQYMINSFTPGASKFGNAVGF